MANREGRGWLSSINKLPREASEIVFWAELELREREREQQDILLEFNQKLAEIDLGPISKSAFNRHAMATASALRRMQDTREITKVLTENSKAGDEDKLTIMLSEMIKTLVFELINSKGVAGFSPKQTMEMASAVKSASAAQHISSSRREKLEAQTAEKVNAAIDKVAELSKTEGGLDAEALEKIRRGVLGVKPKAANGK